MMLFSGLGMISIVIYLVLFVLAGMFFYWGIVYFKRKMETDKILLQKLDQLIKVLDNGNHNTNMEE